MKTFPALATSIALTLSLASHLLPGALAQCADARLQAGDGASDDRFGRAVALHGARAVVGAYWRDEIGPRSGAAYVFEWDGVAWAERAKLLPSQGEAGALFGSAVAVHGDLALVGTPAEGIGITGAAYIYERVGSGWVEVARLQPLLAGQGVGATVLLDGRRAVVASPLGGFQPVSVFEEVGGTWQLTGEVFDMEPLSTFGSALAIQEDTLVIGADFAGRANVFEEQPSGWVETQVLSAGAPSGTDGFGGAIALEGERMLIGAPFADVAALNAGAVYQYERAGGVWSMTQVLTAADANVQDGFGVSIGLEGDVAWIGARRDDAGGAEAGAIYSFELGGAGWVQTEKILAPDPQADSFFGNALAYDRGRLLVGAEQHDAVAPDSGAAYVLERERPLGVTSCAAALNSTGAAAGLAGHGCPAVDANRLELAASSLPAGRFGYFLMSAGQDLVPLFGGGAGELCLAAPFVRFAADILVADPAGRASFTPDLAQLPGGTVIAPGETWTFQMWFRDGGLSSSNLSDALAVTFATAGPPAVQFPVTLRETPEDATVVALRIDLSQPAAGEVSVPYTVSGTATPDVDFRLAEPSPLVFPTGETTIVLPVTIAEDAASEADETIVITLGAPTGGMLGTLPVLELTVRDDD